MKKVFCIIVVLLTFKSLAAFSQDENEGQEGYSIFGFVRAGIYGQYKSGADKINIPTAYYDLAIKSELPGKGNFKFYGDIRLRYGSEFNKEVIRPEVREAYFKFFGSRWEITAGQQIVKWGYSDFSGFSSKLSARNLISRSPDSEDFDLGNAGLRFSLSPTDKFTLDAAIFPMYRGSVLLTDPFELPSYASLESLNGIRTDALNLSYGLRAVLRLRGIDSYLSWFDGYDPMPGINLKSFNLDFSGPLPVPSLILAVKQYQTKTISAGFESAAGRAGIRGEVSINLPDKAGKEFEFIQLKEINWSTGIDFSTGNLSIYGEYSGKKILDYFKPLADPVLGSEIDMAALAAMLMQPGFDPEAYIREQTYSFNRLYNNQLKEYYHTLSCRFEGDLFYGKFAPSLTTQYNITTSDLYLLGSLGWKPTDGIKITLSWDYLSGRKSSLFDLADDYLRGASISFRADF